MWGSGTILMVAYGPAAVGALGGAIRAAQADDPLAPVTVVIPSAHAAVSVRRHLARLPHEDGRAGLTNVSWVSLPQLADLIAGPRLVADGRPSLTPVMRRAAIRAALDDGPGRFAQVIDNPSTEASLERTFADLGELDAAELDRLAAAGGRPRDLVRLFRSFTSRCAAFADQPDVFAAATSQIASASPGPSSWTATVGSIVVYVPTRLSRAERRLLATLAGATPVTVLLGLTGEAEVDGPIRLLGSQLGADLDVTPVDLGRSGTGAPDVHGVEAPALRFVRAPDADEEVRAAVRRVLDALEQGIAPDDIAIVSRAVSPYALLVHEHLRVAGVPHYAPASVSLGQSVAGRVLVGFVALAEGGFRRAELFRWVRSAPVRFPDGRVVSRRFDTLARRAGVAGGIDQWHRRLDRLAAEFGRDPERRAFDLERLDELRAFVDALAARAEPPSERTWSALAAWADDVLGDLLGGRAQTEDWPEHEQDSFDRVREVIASLATLDAIEPTVGLDRFGRVLRQELEPPTRPAGSFGHGVFVGRLGDLAGARHDLVIVVGMAEGIFPPRGQDDPLLPDHERQILGGVLPDRRPSRAEETRAFLAARHAAPAVQLSFARVDTRGQREAMPARLFLRELSVARGVHTGFDDLDQLARGEQLAPVDPMPPGLEEPVVSGAARPVVLVDLPSFEAGARRAAPALGEQELVVGALLAGAPAPVALARGLAAVSARVAGTFSEWTGAIGSEHAPRFTGDKVGSSTSFEQYASCPFRYFLGHVLGVRPLDTYADADAISGLDRGSLVHEVLEVFIREHVGRRADQPWTAADHERLLEIVREVADRYEAQGRTGRPLLWQLELDGLARRLRTILDVDAASRAAGGVEPVAVEFHFGADEEAEGDPVEFTLPSGRSVAFRGAIDRVDRDPASQRLVVIDYKTGQARGYDEIDEDITCRGRHLQLVIYGEAARRHFGGREVESYYWFVEQKRSAQREGGPIGDPQRQRFLEVLDVLVGGIEGGRFPANPGEPNFFGFDHCGFCEYDRLCPQSRDDQWEGVRLSGALQDYVQLADPDPQPAVSPGAQA